MVVMGVRSRGAEERGNGGSFGAKEMFEKTRSWLY
jgi:hypothetical protein